MKDTITLTHKLAAFAATSDVQDARMQRFVQLSLFDWATVGIAGTHEPVARAARMMALETAPSSKGATLFGGGRASAAAAALVNGATSHALDYDDTHFGHIGHPSVAVIPAALAAAETAKADAATFLDAVAVGLETACRVGAWLGRSHYEAGFHQTGTSGAFGATAAAARVLGLDAATMSEALCLAATRAAGLKSQFGTMGKPLNAGFAAEVGVTCALLAQAGATSSPDAIEGVQGFGVTHAGSAERAALDQIGTDWQFPRVSYKFHACCHGLHAMLEALRDLRSAGVVPGDVEAVTIRTHPRWLAVCNQPAPATGLQAKFSYRLTAAMMLGGVDTASLEVYSDETCARDDLQALRDRVTVQPDDSLTDSQASVSVVVRGQTLEAHHDILADADPNSLEHRLRAKATTLIGAAAAEDLWNTVSGLGASRSTLDRLAERVGAPAQSAGPRVDPSLAASIMPTA
ncbi:MmgE/PrpD family protein [Paracoccus sp. M683]|uniref:MmgE/PrpD family protein n=1 Tax=Paracoccus sp. M683 TaxID=2594268 RepID=UPI00117DC1DC|nr:MmgE/PrpD family protein [Paracoccus sp. M683]TRW94588.1 MmgE/PrpD family protein [Paracoccus sp. M683]